LDELERVKRLYGSVAEYNRVMEEESGRAAYEREIDELTQRLKESRPDLSDDEIEQVLQNAQNDCDADVCLCLETLIFWADKMYPKKKYSYTVEITETLQMRVDVDADSPDDALAAVEHSYRVEHAHILNADNFTGVDFTIVDSDPPDNGGTHD